MVGINPGTFATRLSKGYAVFDAAFLNGPQARARTSTKHGMCKTPEYSIWQAMITRCRVRPNYVSKGIKVCERWRLFVNFYADMGARPSNQYSIDRIDNNGNYEPGNCRWTTREVQNRNTSRNVFVCGAGEGVTVADIAEKFNIPYKRALQRAKRGLDLNEVISPIVRGVKRNSDDACDTLGNGNG